MLFIAITIVSTSGGLYLPPPDTRNMKYFKDLVTGHKSALDKDNARVIQVLRYPELNSKMALQQCLLDETAMRFVPDHWVKDKAKVSREYLWVVLASVQPEYTSMVLNRASNNKLKPIDDDGNQL